MRIKGRKPKPLCFTVEPVHFLLPSLQGYLHLRTGTTWEPAPPTSWKPGNSHPGVKRKEPI